MGATNYVLAKVLIAIPQLRVYGMKYFDDKAPYWGNTTKKIIRAGGDRFTLRSAKFVVDG